MISYKFSPSLQLNTLLQFEFVHVRLYVFVLIENPYHKLITNQTILAPLASSPFISIFVVINSDGTKEQQNNVTGSLRLVNESSNTEVGKFKQDPARFQLYHYIFPPLKRSDNGSYIIYSGIHVVFIWYADAHQLYLIQN